MDEPKQPNTAVWAVAFAIITSIITYWQYEAKLVSPRPPFQGARESSTIGDQRFPARLWQDPWVNPGTNAPDSIESLRKQIERRQGNSNNDDYVEVLGVMTTGTPYPEDIERRLRARYAVVTALFSQNFTLESGTEIGLAQMTWPTKAHILEVPTSPSEARYDPRPFQAAFQSRIDLLNYDVRVGGLLYPETAESRECLDRATLIMPYEWAESNQGSKEKSVLILWLEEEQFSDYPLVRLSRLMTKLGLIGQAASNNFKLKLIGPWSSGVLKAMLTDPIFTGDTNRYQNAEIEKQQLTNHVQVFSPSATAPDAEILPGANNKFLSPTREAVVQAFATNLGSSSFSNFIITDDILAYKMVQELHLRGFEVNQTNDYALVLISESDTAYGRTLPACFAAIVKKRIIDGGFLTNSDIFAHAKINSLLCGTNLGPWPPNVRRFSYLRGLDGTQAKERADKGDSEASETGKEKSAQAVRSPGEYERAQGEAQYDYVRRLADSIKEWERKCFHYNVGRKHRLAIGVLGSDPYDKIILLEALRSRFRDAIFFATDLDARYSEKQQQEYCRNLLISSSEGLEPATDDDGGHAPPSFREVYQTCIFNACCFALGGKSVSPSTHAHIFEIGLKHVIDLEMPPKGLIDVWSWRFRRSILFIVCGLIGTACLARPVANAVNFAFVRRRKRHKRTFLSGYYDNYKDSIANCWHKRRVRLQSEGVQWMTFWIILGLVALIFLWWHSFRDGDSKTGQPFYWTEGISIWPTELIRTITGFVGIFCLVQSWFLFRRHQTVLWQRFFGPEDSIPPTFEMDDFVTNRLLPFATLIDLGADPISRLLKERFDRNDKVRIANAASLCATHTGQKLLKRVLMRNINSVIVTERLHLMRGVVLKGDAVWFSKLNPEGYQLMRLNHLILQDFYSSYVFRRKGSARGWRGMSKELRVRRFRMVGFLQAIRRSVLKPWLPQLRGYALSTWESVVIVLWPRYRYRRRWSINRWEETLDFVNARRLFKNYLIRASLRARCYRVLRSCVFYLIFATGMFWLWDGPIIPARGHASFQLDSWILFFSVLIFVSVVFYVVDSTFLTARMIRHLGDGTTVWPDHLQRKLAVDFNLDPAHVPGYLDVKFVAYHTQEVGRRFYYPFLMLTMLLLARNEFFASWTWSPALLAIFLTTAILVFVPAFHIRRSAERVRKQAVAALQEFLVKFSSGDDEKYEWNIPLNKDGTTKKCQATDYSEKIKELIREIKEVNTGAYAIILRDDSVSAALLPIIGATLLAITQKLFLQ